MTYKKAIRIIINILKEHGLEISKGAQKQAGYLALYATEAELNRHLDHHIKNIMLNLKCNFVPGSMTDDVFETRLTKYAELLQKENPEGGEVTLGWLQKEASGKELWAVFSGQEI